MFKPRRSRVTGTCVEPISTPLVRLWILRILMRLNARRQLFAQDGFHNDDVAAFLGFQDLLDTPELFDRSQVAARLRDMHAHTEHAAPRMRPPAVLASNIARLSRMLELTAEDSSILTFAVLLHVDETLDSVADWLGQIGTIRLARVLSRILDLPQRTVAERLGPHGTLARSGLMSVCRHGASYMRSKLDLLSTTFADLVSSQRVDAVELLRDIVAPAPPPELQLSDYAHLGASLEVLGPYLGHALSTRRQGVNIFVHGPSGTGKTQLVRAIARTRKCDLFEVSSEDNNGDPVDGERRLRAFRAAQTLLAKKRATILFDEVEDVFNDGSEFLGRKSTAQTRKAWMNRMLEDSTTPTFWLSNSIATVDPAFLRRFDMIIEVPVPPRSQRQRIVQRAGADLVDARCISRLAESDRLAPAVIARAASVVRAILPTLGKSGVERALEHLVGNTLEAQGHARLARHDPSRLPETYDPALLNPDTDINAICEGLRRSGQGRICLYGPPGTGKTAFGRWLAQRLDLPLHVRRASDLLSPYVGMTEKNLALAFREAERESALLLVDEIDSFLRDRKEAQRAWEATQVNEMLTQMEGFSGILITSTNLINGLDAAALRRFDAKIHFGFLKPAQRLALLRSHCVALGLPPPGATEEAALARLPDLAPGDFAALARQNRFRPIDSAGSFVRLLQAECALKGESSRRIGFVHQH